MDQTNRVCLSKWGGGVGVGVNGSESVNSVF